MTREEAILCLKGMKNYARDTFTEQTDWQTSLDMAIEALKKESAEPTGHWKEHYNPEATTCMQYMSECSLCGKMICHRYNVYMNFCPNCGAKMERSDKV